jgi:hypothetical protein
MPETPDIDFGRDIEPVERVFATDAQALEGQRPH